MNSVVSVRFDGIFTVNCLTVPQKELYVYVHHLLEHIGAGDTVKKVEALLPWNVSLETVSKKCLPINKASGWNSAYC